MRDARGGDEKGVEWKGWDGPPIFQNVVSLCDKFEMHIHQ